MNLLVWCAEPIIDIRVDYIDKGNQFIDRTDSKNLFTQGGNVKCEL